MVSVHRGFSAETRWLLATPNRIIEVKLILLATRTSAGQRGAHTTRGARVCGTAPERPAPHASRRPAAACAHSFPPSGSCEARTGHFLDGCTSRTEVITELSSEFPRRGFLPCRQRLLVDPATRRRPRFDDAGCELSVIACVIQATDTVGPAGRLGAGREGVECQSWRSPACTWHVDYASQAFED